MYDIIIIGGGAAGLTAALYARRANKTVLIVEKGSFGGQITFSPLVENFPTRQSMSGVELADALTEQVLSHGADVEIDTVTGIEDMGSFKRVIGESGSYDGLTAIVATGATHRMLGLPREGELVGEGISFCAVCDGAFYKDKNVCVIGGGNSALQEAVLLSELCSKVTVIQNLDFLTGEEKLAEQLRTKDNVDFIFGTTVAGLIGDDSLTGVELKNEKTGELSTLEVDGMFIAIGLVPQNAPFEGVMKLNEYGYADSAEDCLTATPGVFVAGDCRSKTVRQLTTAAADGSVAALAACRFVDALK
ncbi:MAG: FAD-dependent oxidoreductase [Clostridia bacterium]|nr:FAD-dependent oxidoreductase [Clostridia bacterium]